MFKRHVVVEILTVLVFVSCHYVVLLQTYNFSSVMHHVTGGMCVSSCERGVCGHLKWYVV